MSEQLRHGEKGPDFCDDCDDQRAKDHAPDAVYNVGLHPFERRLETHSSLPHTAGISGAFAIETTHREQPRLASAACTIAITASAGGSMNPASRSRFVTFRVSIAIVR
jgi:hypothetical protein